MLPSFWSAALIALLLTISPPAVTDEAPQWFLENIRAKADAGGVWITDNAAYREADGGIDAYGIEWKLALGGQGLTGRLFGLRDGEEVGPFWEFRTFWHPGVGEARVYQFGLDGTVGIGSMEPPTDGPEILVQTFYRPDGSEYRSRHVNHVEGDREEGESQTWVDGAWRSDRTYVWHRQR